MDFTFITTAPQVQAHLQSPKRKELMSQLLSKYRNAGIADVELQELDVPPDVKAPIEMFGIPFVPHLIRVLLKSFVKTSELYPNLDLLRFNNPNDSQRVLIPLTQPISKESYRRGGSKTQILNIADRMVPASKAKTDSERKDLACERTTWLLESLVEDKDNEESIRTIAKKKFKMIEPKKMSAADVGGLIKYANLTTTQFVKVKSYTDTFFENKLFCSKDKVRELYEDAIVPKVDKWKSTNSIINYWYNELEDMIKLSIQDEVEESAFVESLEKINIVFAGDHGKGKFRLALKILYMKNDSDDSKILQTKEMPLGEVDHLKDDYELLANTVMPPINDMLREIQEKVVSIRRLQDGSHSIHFLNKEDEEDDLKRVKIEAFICSDLKFYVEVQGRSGRAPHYCYYCDLTRSKMKDKEEEGTVLSHDSLTIFLQNYERKPSDMKACRGCVKPALLTAIPIKNFLFPVLHMLLGTGNDIKKFVMDLTDDCFETWSNELIAMRSQLWEQIKSCNQARLDRDAGVKNCQEEIKSLKQRERIATSEEGKDEIKNEIKELQTQIQKFKDDVRKKKEEETGIRNRLNESKKNRRYTDLPIKQKILNVFIKNGVNVANRQGGTLEGNDVRRFMAKAEPMLSKMRDILKEVAAENRRKRTIDDTSPMTDDEIDIAFKYATFCLGLADDIYAKCMAPAGSLSEDDLQDIESTVRDFSKAWRAGNFPSTPKFHTIEKHLVRDYLRRFRGLKEYEESFMERSHQIFSNYESKSRCETSYFKKAILHNKWDRRDEHPKVKKH